MAKFTKSELKGLLKECINEMIVDGSLAGMIAAQRQQPVTQRNPLARAAAAQMAKNPNEASVLESIFADTAATTMMETQNAPDPYMAMQMMQQQGQGGYYPPQYQQPMQMMAPQMMPGQQYVQVPPVDGFMQRPQQQHHQPQQSGGTNWARLAFNSPIRNRPGEGALSSAADGFRPGQNMGKFS